MGFVEYFGVFVIFIVLGGGGIFVVEKLTPKRKSNTFTHIR